MQTSLENSITDYNEHRAAIIRATNPRVIEAFELKLEIENERRELKIKEDELALKEETLKKLLSDIGAYRNDYITITDMKLKPRQLNMPWIKENMPEVYAVAEPSPKFLLSVVTEKLGIKTLKAWAKEMDPEGYDKSLTLRLSVWDELTGDSSSKRKYSGRAYRDEMVPIGDGTLSIRYTEHSKKFLGHHNPYPVHDDDGDD